MKFIKTTLFILAVIIVGAGMSVGLIFTQLDKLIFRLFNGRDV